MYLWLSVVDSKHTGRGSKVLCRFSINSKQGGGLPLPGVKCVADDHLLCHQV